MVGHGAGLRSGFRAVRLARLSQSTNINSLVRIKTCASWPSGESVSEDWLFAIQERGGQGELGGSGDRPSTRRYRQRTWFSPWFELNLSVNRRGQLAGLLLDERTVHEEEGLLGHGGDEPLGAGGVGNGEVKGAVNAVEVLAVDEAVNGAAGWQRRL